MINRVQGIEEHLKLEKGGSVTALFYPANEPRLNAGYVLAHGAGAGQTSPFIRDFAIALSERGINVLTFHFPYIEAKRRIPDRNEVLEACLETAIGKLRELSASEDRIFIGGKSMGGRIASQLAARKELALSGLILLGYPLHPPGKPDQLRTAHLSNLKLPILIIQGTRDIFGTPDELRPWFKTEEVTVYPVEGGDHSFKVRKGASAQSQAEVYARIQDRIRDWISQNRYETSAHGLR